MKYIYWLKDAGEADVSLVGYKARALGKMMNGGFLVPSGFILASDGISRFLEEAGILSQIKELCASLAFGVESSEISFAISELVHSAEFSPELSEDLLDHYEIFGATQGGSVAEGLVVAREASVAVRQSCANSSLQGKVKLAVNGVKDLLNAIKSLVAGYYSAPNLKIHKGEGYPAILVQEMINSQKSGLVFTNHPFTGDTEKSVIEAVYGLGNSLGEEGSVYDSYVVSNGPREVVSCEIDEQIEGAFHDDGKIVQRSVDLRDQANQTLTDRECGEVTRQGQKAQKSLGGACKLSFSIIGENVYLLSAKPLNVERKIESKAESSVGISAENNENQRNDSDVALESAKETSKVLTEELEQVKEAKEKLDEVEVETEESSETLEEETQVPFVTNVIPAVPVNNEELTEELGDDDGDNEDDEPEESEETDDVADGPSEDEDEAEDSTEEDPSEEELEGQGNDTENILTGSDRLENSGDSQSQESNRQGRRFGAENSYRKSIPKYPSFKKKGGKFGRNVYS